MKVLIYTNREKDPDKVITNKLKNMLENAKITYLSIEHDDFDKYSENCEVIFIIGGDGTILNLTEFIKKFNLKIIGINAGNLGFLTEYETSEMQTAVDNLKNNKYVEDKRMLLDVEFKNKTYHALNDAVIQRIYNDSYNSLIVKTSINIDGIFVDRIDGDGVIISTPTGSTAYSLSAGGTVLSPDINALSMTPICAHSINHKPIVFSANSTCQLSINNGSVAGLFVDGKFIDFIDKNCQVTVKKSLDYIIFLREQSFNFYNRLFKKLNIYNGEIHKS